MNKEHNVIRFCGIADKSFDPNNKKIALQIKHKVSISQGKCLEISSDGGQMGIAIAESTDLLKVYLYDSSELSLSIASRRINERELKDRVVVLPWDTPIVPVENETMNLVVGIRSVWFLSNYVRSLNEIYRVLAPNGYAYIRVGSALEKLKNECTGAGHYVKSLMYKESVINRDKLIEQLIQAISETRIKNFEISDELSGVWLLIKKE